MAHRTVSFISIVVVLLFWTCFCTKTQEQALQAVDDVEELERKWGFDWAFSGISTFGHLPHVKCLTQPPEFSFDIGIIGAPFDTAVSYRPGARLGPRSIRAASARHISNRGFNPHANVNPYASWAKILDCGDIPVTPFDNAVALRQMTEAFTQLGMRPPAKKKELSEELGLLKPKLIILGGDHLVVLPALRALRKVHNEPVALLHFDAHLDTLSPEGYPNAWPSKQAEFNHGSVFWKATTEGLLKNNSVHAGINTRLSGVGWSDFEADDRMGFLRIPVDAVDEIGTKGIIHLIKQKLGTDTKVYMSIDIDVLDPAFAPGTGAPEPGGWTTREMLKIIRGLDELNIVGADIVEVAPAYDSPGSDTAFVAASLVYEILTSMVKQGSKAEIEYLGHLEGEGPKTEL